MLFISWDIDETNGLVLNLGHAKMIDFLDLISLSFSTSISRLDHCRFGRSDRSQYIYIRTVSSYSMTLVHSYSTANPAHLPQNWAKLAKLAVLFKGQLISKANCQAVDSPKKRTNEFAFF